MKGADTFGTANRLIHEQSPYLLQHAHNPVDWFPWGDEAFCQAKENDKPVFLSIGYATCHWCHVMERESFSDQEVADLLNRYFICIKVDREERPDIDQIYMTAAQLLSGTGGWPLSIFMTPGKKPFFAATYIPKQGTHTRAGLLDLIPRIAAMWQDDRERLLSAAEEVTNYLQARPKRERSQRPGRAAPEHCFEELVSQFDRINGGFGRMPKFPLHPHILFLHRYWKRKESEKALQMATRTLDMMAVGGLYDHIGSGFHRYSTDERWLVPHFEKMLYDQALAILSYCQAFRITGSDLYRQVARGCLSYVANEMTSPDGAFYSAQDADSEGVEGQYYLSREEIERVLFPEEMRVFSLISHVTTPGNFIDPLRGERTGNNIIHIAIPPHEAARTLGMTEPEVREILDSARGRLHAARKERVAPRTDDKILTDWNALIIAAFAYAAGTFDNGEYLGKAEKAAEFILHRLKDPDGRLLHRYRNGEAGIEGMAADHVYLAWGLLELYAASFKPEYLEKAREFMDKLEQGFRDRRSGGYYTAPEGSGDLIVRQKDLADSVLPSANSVAYSTLLRLYLLTGDPTFQQRAKEQREIYSAVVERSPVQYSYFCAELLGETGPSSQVVIVGDPDSKECADLIEPLRTAFLPFTQAILRKPGKNAVLDRIVEFSSSYTLFDDRAAAYVCSGHTCSQPATDPAKLRTFLGIPKERD